jgi:hypothetical protein
MQYHPSLIDGLIAKTGPRLPTAITSAIEDL